MQLIDTHAHLYATEFEDDIAAIIDSAKRNGVSKVYLPAIDHQTNAALLRLTDSNPDFFLPMMGVHPCSIGVDFENELATCAQLIDTRTDWVAIGEIGLDFFWDVSFKEQQIKAFEMQIQWAIDRDLPIVIHSRKSTYQCIEILKKYKGKVGGIFHCFSGSLEEANEIIKLGFYLGIGGVVTFKNAGLKEILPQIGLAHIVLETDAPYLAPVPYRGKRNESSYLKIIAHEIAQILHLSVGEVAEKTSENALQIFKR